MNIGSKIKKIRVEKLMTQSELAGNVITRNMLSQIENGIAQPSLGTILHISQKLGVPAGYLLSEGEEEFIYNKAKVMRDIRRAYSDKNFELCYDICNDSFDEFDDEIELILTDCCIGTAEEYIKGGKLYSARQLLDEALNHAANTIYSTVTQKNSIYIMFHLLKTLSPTLDSDEIDTEIGTGILNPSLFGDVFCKYIAILSGKQSELDADKLLYNAGELSEQDKLFIAHIKARRCLLSREYRKASTILRSIMDGETVPSRLLLYICCGDMEKCCKEMEDYKGAYEFSNNKMEILEHMLADA